MKTDVQIEKEWSLWDLSEKYWKLWLKWGSFVPIFGQEIAWIIGYVGFQGKKRLFICGKIAGHC